MIQNLIIYSNIEKRKNKISTLFNSAMMSYNFIDGVFVKKNEIIMNHKVIRIGNAGSFKSMEYCIRNVRTM